MNAESSNLSVSVQEPSTLDIAANCFGALVANGLGLESRLDNEQREHNNTRWIAKVTETSLHEAQRVMEDRLQRIQDMTKFLEDAKALIMNSSAGIDLRTSSQNAVWAENQDRWLDGWTELFGVDPRKEDRPQLAPVNHFAEDSDDNLDRAG